MSELLKSVEYHEPNPNVAPIRPGDTVRVHARIVEGNRERVQVFQGTVIRLRGGGANRNFTVRRVASHGVGVERTFLLHSPRLERVEVLRHGHVRRSKLYYLRDRKGKSARLREKRD
jgi:large subunit ribosomal protein L19